MEEGERRATKSTVLRTHSSLVFALQARWRNLGGVTVWWGWEQATRGLEGVLRKNKQIYKKSNVW